MKLLLVASLMILWMNLPGLTIYHDNIIPVIEDRGDYNVIGCDSGVFADEPGKPAIPLTKVFFLLPEDEDIRSINIIPAQTEHITLEKPLFPSQAAVPLIKVNDPRFIPPDPLIYSGTKRYPEEPLFQLGSGWLGDCHIGFVSFYTASYDPHGSILEVPRSFRIEVVTFPIQQGISLPDGYVSRIIRGKLGLADSRSSAENVYLLITPESFLEHYEPLLEWRYQQGLAVYYITVEEIQNQFQGSDIQEKIRNCIIDYYSNTSVSFVTLGADVNYIPDRKVFAFDCAYGGSPDENDIPCDMYYSCLNGNWDANENNVFGEDDDETDFFPEVFVARIPANSAEEVDDYINRLLYYEKGYCDDYNRAGGMSMELWPGSQSQICQQFIYNTYFPDYYDINLLYGAENNVDNVYEMLNLNQNIVQHTGHASRNAITLQSGHITADNLYMLENEYGGLFYSIGCWSAAFDYPSIGEKLLITPEKGQLAYIGNSRYGWGAPSAPGFGFSEFFQKEYFRNLFWEEETLLAEANAIQKIDFIPYFYGTSVYKWIAYELNALGDSYFNLYTANPSLVIAECFLQDSLAVINISSGDSGLANMTVTCGEYRDYTDVNGEVILPAACLQQQIVFYKYGYECLTIDEGNFQNNIFIGSITGNLQEDGYLQGESLTIGSVLYNYTPDSIDFNVEYSCPAEIMILGTGQNPVSIEPFSQLALADLDVHILPVSESLQLPSGTEIDLQISIIDINSGNSLTSRIVPILVKAPELVLNSLNFLDQLFLPGSQICFDFEIQNQGLMPANGLSLTFFSDSADLDFETPFFDIYLWLDPGESVCLSNKIFLPQEATSGDVLSIGLEMDTNCQEQNYDFSRILALPIGEAGFNDDFENGFTWDSDDFWQLVDTYAHSGNYSLSCRPESTGEYNAATPVFVYMPSQELGFWYKYRMPMYGEDGVYFLLDCAGQTDTLLFLGAGGALSDEKRPVLAYIESDWAEYKINLDEYLEYELETGEAFSLQLQFKFAEEFPGFNQYALMNDIGVFIDDISIDADFGEPVSDQGHDIPVGISVYPNPILAGQNLHILFNLSGSGDITAALYNLKGQKVISLAGREPLQQEQAELYWDGRDGNNRLLDSGIYFLFLKKGNREYIRKVTYFK
ncbi:MAG: T9SS type A sorting domain-containing protein [Candidatus Cloacimonetes bacterium]|nr:T9SS type A sorting domain-containing protein [Candidatus Cloacimonadota bacterium]